ncbi:hypothetical protein ACPC54_24625 [Kitasatospora sp. NPDC094028]
MNPSDFVHLPEAGDTPEQPWEERELRGLLQRAVPPLATPDDRVQRVLARADRTRARRRRAGLAGGLGSGLLAAVLAAAPALAPAPGPDSAAGQGPAARTPAATVSPPAPEASPIRFPLYGLVGNLPPDWYARTFATNPRDGAAHLANLPFDPNTGCKAADLSCLPTGPLPIDGVVVTLRLGVPPDSSTGGTASPAVLAAVVPGKECGARGGNRELLGHRQVAANGGLMRIDLTACLRDPSDRTLAQVQQVIDSIRSP